MKIKCISILLIALLYSSLTASAQSWLWGEQGSTGLKADEFSQNVATNRTGNVYHAGSFGPSIIFGTDTLIIGGAYLVKYDQNGNVLWARQSTLGAVSYSVATDDSDNSYITGISWDTTTFGTDTLYESGQLFIIKYDPNGNVIWANQADTNIVKGIGWSVAMDNFGHEYVTGDGCFLLKYDRNGNIIWAVVPKSTNNNGLTYGYNVVTDISGNVYISGAFQDSLNFGTYQLYSVNRGVFIAKFDSTGNVLWAQQSINNSYNPTFYRAVSVATDKSGSAYLTGTFTDNITLANYTFTSPTDTTYNFFVIKYKPDGTIDWGKEGIPLESYLNGGWSSYSICSDDSNHIYIAGGETRNFWYNSISNSFAFANDTLSVMQIGSDVPSFLLKLDSSGNVICGSTLNNGGAGNNITSDSLGKFIYMGGEFYTTLTFGNDSLIDNTGGYDTYVVRWQSCAGCDLMVTTNPQLPSVCSGQDVTLTANGGINYTWSPATGLSAKTGDTVIASPTVTTTYIVTSYSNGCMTTDTDVVTIIPSPNKPTFTQRNDTLISSSLHDNQWYRNDTLLKNDTSQELIIATLGNYWVIVNNEANGCSTSSDSMNITQITGIEQLTVNSGQVTVYPNPTNGTIFITINSSVADIKDWNLQIINVLGQTVYSKSALNPLMGTFNIDLSDLPNGVYLISVMNKTGRTVVPVVKQN